MKRKWIPAIAAGLAFTVFLAALMVGTGEKALRRAYPEVADVAALTYILTYDGWHLRDIADGDAIVICQLMPYVYDGPGEPVKARFPEELKQQLDASGIYKFNETLRCFLILEVIVGEGLEKGDCFWGLCRDGGYLKQSDMSFPDASRCYIMRLTESSDYEGVWFYGSLGAAYVTGTGQVLPVDASLQGDGCGGMRLKRFIQLILSYRAGKLK